MLPVLGAHGRGREVAHVAAGPRLGDGDTHALLAREDVGHEALLQRRAAELQDRRQPERYACGDGSRWPEGPRARHLVDVDECVQVVEVLDTEAAGEVRYADLVQPFYGQGCGEVGD